MSMWAECVFTLWAEGFVTVATTLLLISWCMRQATCRTHSRTHEHTTNTQMVAFTPFYIQTLCLSITHTHTPCQIDNKSVLLSCYGGLSYSPLPLPLFSSWSPLFSPFSIPMSPPLSPIHFLSLSLIFLLFNHFFLSLSLCCAFPLPLLFSPLVPSSLLPLWQIKAEISSSLWSGWDWHTPTGLAVGGGEQRF